MKNKRQIKITVLLALSAIVFLISQLTTNSLEKGVTANNVGAIERTLHNLQNESREVISRVISHCPENIIPSFDSIRPQELHTKGVFIFVTDTISPTTGNSPKRILYWSDNLPVTIEQLENITEESKYMYLGNGWYVAQAFKHRAFKYITLILIEREYVYQNQFLRNETNPAFNFPKNIIILPLGDIGIPVKDINGIPLFILNSDIPSMLTSGISLLFRWLTVIFICFVILSVFRNPGLYKKNLWYLLPAFVLLAGLRIFIYLNPAFFNGDLYLFSPSLYADSEFLPSLGDLLLHLLFLFFFIIILFSAKDASTDSYSAKLNRTKKTVIFVIFGVLISVFLCAALYIAESLAFNSEISFKVYKMSDITIYTFLAYFIIALVFALLCLLIYFQISLSAQVKIMERLVTQGAITLIILFLLMGLKPGNLIVFIVFFLIYFLFQKKITLSTFVWLTMLISFYTSFSLIINTNEKEHKKRELLAEGLLAESDPVAEMLLKDMENKIASDPYLQKVLTSDLFNTTDLYEILTDKYFRGYFQRYDLYYHACKPNTNLHITDENKEENCIGFFVREKAEKGTPVIGSSHFWYMNNYWGRIHYLGDFKFIGDKDTTSLFLELYTKREIESSVGYPELLRFESSGIDYEAEGYSYAKYSEKKRVSKVGTYDYSFELTPKSYKNGFFEKNGYSHYSFTTKDDNVVILSLPKLGFSGVVSIFSYSFVIFIVILFILFTIAGLKLELPTNRNSYRWKISTVILVGIIGALTTLTIAMLAYTISQSEKKNLETIHSKMQSTIIELDQSLFAREKITPDMYYDLGITFVVLSNAFNTDLNMYDMSGDLIVTSRNEIFDKNLIGTKMNRDALYTLATEKQSKFIHSERIGKISYYSSYTTYYNRKGEAIAYLNILYFNNQSEFRNELLSLTGAIMNIYIFLIVIGISLSVFVSNQITRPLDVVRRKMAELNLSKQPEPIDYKANNELGDLVRVYNRMIGQLAESAKILAENERESAWREMARQIAHEIKNPLTPMKLNIQLALRMKNQNRQGWQAKMDEAINSTLEQIDILSYIASEFSNFARTGKVELEPVNLSQAILSAISLFSGYNNINITFDDDKKECWVKANKEQLQRVLTNLIKNSIQATENVPTPEIIIVLDKRETNYVVRISDNGTGISAEVSKNLFQPNFTTKSSGTGLGLAISKSIIESFGGTIAFVPDKTGACFEIILNHIDT
jgi:signal transduction histidine kinase